MMNVKMNNKVYSYPYQTLYIKNTEVYQQLKLYCSLNNIKMWEVVTEAIRYWLSKHNKKQKEQNK